MQNSTQPPLTFMPATETAMKWSLINDQEGKWNEPVSDEW